MPAWNDVLGALWGAASAVLPKCACGRPALPVLCIECGNGCCEQHAWVNPATLRVLCSTCIAQLDGSWRQPQARPRPQRAAPQPPPPAKGEDPWRVLGIKPTSDEGVVQRAFRKQAKKHHPDHGGNPQQFMLLQRAREEALRRIRENG